MECSSCQKRTTAVRIGTGDFCSDCGKRLSSAATIHSTPVAPAAKIRRNLDIGVGRSSVVGVRLQRPTALPVTSPVKRVMSDMRAVPKKAALTAPDVHDRRIQAQPPTAKTIPSQVAAKTISEPPIIAPASKVIPPKVEPVTFAATPHLTSRERIRRAKQIERSDKVSRFPVTKSVSTVSTPTQSGHELPPSAITHHEALSRLIPTLPPVELPYAGSKRSRIAVSATVIAVLAGYIWLNNYPKMTVEAAGTKAGLSASLPGFMPSSYSLKKTSSSPGMVTLSFASPNETQDLSIQQRATTWDSQSLLDNYVTTQSKSYSTVEGQGLTIYLYNNNEASWINHGVWYSILGTTRLSHDEIAKIAYSL